MVMIPTRKPCPFCGSSDSFVERMEICCYQVICNDCYAHGPSVEHADYGTFPDETREYRDASRAWNRRRPRRSLLNQEKEGQ